MAEGKSTREIDAQAVSPEAHSPSAQLRDKRTTPEGVVPKQAQGYVIAGLAVLILMAVMFSKNHAKPPSKAAPASLLVMSTDMNQRKIQELEQDLSADQRQSQQAQKTTSGNAASAGTPSSMQPNGSMVPVTPLPPPSEPPRDPIADAEKALAFKARFASNLVSANDGASRPSAESPDHPESLPVPSAARPSDLPAQATAPQAATNKRAPEVNVNSAHGQPYALFEGTTIDTALVNRLMASSPGR